MFMMSQKMWVRLNNGECVEVPFSRAAMKNLMMSSVLNFYKTKSMASQGKSKESLWQLFCQLIRPRYSF